MVSERQIWSVLIMVPVGAENRLPACAIAKSIDCLAPKTIKNTLAQLARDGRVVKTLERHHAGTRNSYHRDPGSQHRDR